jgi:NTE family protein
MLIENLVFEGGGVKGSCYAGSIKALTELNLLKDVQRCAGTSAGSIMATLISIGCDTQEIDYIISNLNFKSLKDKFNPFRILTKYGLYSGDAFIKWLQTCINRKGLNIDITFKELHELKLKDSKYKDLYVFATSLNTESIQGFSVDKTPDVKIVDAVRASMSIPLFFKSWKIKQFPNDVFVDGGLAYNYPISVFDNKQFLENVEDEVNDKTIGFFLGSLDTSNSKIKNLNYNELNIYINSLFSSILNIEIMNFRRRKQDVDRTIFIPDFGISSIDFNLTKDDVKKLYDSGYNSTLNYFKNK